MSTTYLRILLLVALATVLQTISTADAAEQTNCTHKPELSHPRECCAVPNLATAEIRSKCLQKRRDHWRSMRPHTRGQRYRNRRHFNRRSQLKQMYWSCVLNETGIIANGTLQHANLTEYLHKITDDVHLIPIVVESFEFCMNFNYSSLNATHPHHHSHHHGHHHGHRHPRYSCHGDRHHRHRYRHNGRHRFDHHGRHYFLHRYNNSRQMWVNETNARRLVTCVYQEAFINCPQESWNDTDVCNAKRDFIQHCRMHNATLPEVRPATETTDAPLPMPVPNPMPSLADDDEDQVDQLGFMSEENGDGEMTADDDDDDDDADNGNDAGLNELDSEISSLNSASPLSPNATKPQLENEPLINLRSNFV